MCRLKEMMKNADIDTLSGIRTSDPSVRSTKDFFRFLILCYRYLWVPHALTSNKFYFPCGVYLCVSFGHQNKKRCFPERHELTELFNGGVLYFLGRTDLIFKMYLHSFSAVYRFSIALGK